MLVDEDAKRQASNDKGISKSKRRQGSALTTSRRCLRLDGTIDASRRLLHLVEVKRRRRHFEGGTELDVCKECKCV